MKLYMTGQANGDLLIQVTAPIHMYLRLNLEVEYMALCYSFV
jgi:hypothetical protein